MNDSNHDSQLPEQYDVPKVMLIPNSELPEGFAYPPEYLLFVGQRIVLMGPCGLINGDEIVSRYEGLKKRYPDRILVPFARRYDCDDIACWEGTDNQKVVVIHDFTAPGWEARGEEYTSFWDWFRNCMEVMIEFLEGEI
ncbi:MAG: hypothetical protein R3C11_24180 [Planctomycetaceae bacterium]